MVMGQNQPYKQVDSLPANAFFHYEGRKFSKSDGWFIDLDDFFTKYSADQIRYCLAANAPEQDDSEFSWKDFQMRTNSELVGKLGNFVNRSLVFIHQKNKGVMPKLENLTDEDKAFIKAIKQQSEAIKASYSSFHLRRATQQIMELASLCNVYFDEMKPWELVKTDLSRMQAVLACCVQGVVALAVCAAPIIPESAQKMWKLLGQEDQLTDKDWDKRLQTHFDDAIPLPKPEIIIQKIDDKLITQEKNKLLKNAKDEDDEMIDFESFKKVDLRVAEVLEAKQLPKVTNCFTSNWMLGEKSAMWYQGSKSIMSQKNS